MLRVLIAALVAMLLLPQAARAAQCGGDFNTFLSQIAREAQGQGVSPQVIQSAFAGLTHAPAVMAFDRKQKASFSNPDLQKFISTRIGPGRINGAKQRLAK